MDAGLDARLRDEQRHHERDRRDEEAVARVGEDQRDRDPGRERDRGVAGREAAAQRRAAAGEALTPITRIDGHRERDERQLRRRVREPVEQRELRSATWPEKTR